MKHLITISIDGPSPGGFKKTVNIMMNACVQARARVNNGTSMRIEACDAGNAQAFNNRIATLLRWHLDQDIARKNKESLIKQITSSPFWTGKWDEAEHG